MIALRCMGVLLVPTRTKRADGDIPFIKFVPVSYCLLEYLFPLNIRRMHLNPDVVIVMGVDKAGTPEFVYMFHAICKLRNAI